MDSAALYQKIQQKKSYLCVGLDTALDKLPPHLLTHEDPILAFNKQIIAATHPYCVAYKLNTAFYEALGSRGWEVMQKTLAYIPKGSFVIADAKRGDIGNTSHKYAAAFFEQLNFDALTVAPYMGEDSVKPFLTFKDRWVILLALTSNEGSRDFQQLTVNGGPQAQPLFERVIQTSCQWASPEQLMFVVGATQAPMLRRIRELIPHHFLLVPGVGAQGGSLAEVSTYGMNKQCGLLVNASRAILYASAGQDFAAAAAAVAQKMQQEMAGYLKQLD